MATKKLNRNIILYGVLAVAAIWVIGSTIPRGTEPEELRFDEFFSRVQAGEVEDATIYLRDQKIEGSLTDGTEYTTTFAGEGEGLADRLAERQVSTEVEPQQPSFLQQLLMNWFPLLLIFGLIIFLLYRAQGGGSGMMSFGKSRAKQVTKETPTVKFGDVAGADEAVEEIREIKDFLSDPARFKEMGAKIPKGVLLYGPPGTGKTLLARAVAGEAGVPFFSISGSDFVEMFVGVGAARVRDLFEQAKQQGPAIVFIDEIDAVGRQRGAGLGGGHDEREQTLNQMLVEMDGFDVHAGVVVIAATNRPDILDPALLRPGRFDRHIVIDRPDLPGRHEILKVHTKNKPIADDVDLEVIARRTPGFTGADLENLVNEGALLSARRGHKRIESQDLENAVDRVIAGPERRSRLITAEERRIIAYHEAGHALVAHVLPHSHPVHKISIIPRGRALGYTLTLPTEDRYLVTKAELTDELAVMLGGRAAEELVFGDVTTGAQDDIDRCTKIARQMVCEYGMSSLGPMALGPKQDAPFVGRDVGSAEYSDRVADEIDAEVHRLIDGAFERAKGLLRKHRKTLDGIVERLMEQETVEAAELEEVFAGVAAKKAERGRVIEESASDSKEKPKGRKRRQAQPKPKPGLSPA